MATYRIVKRNNFVQVAKAKSDIWQ